ncbi:MAG TPA: HNH endonuclease [Pseudosphingobacterium sp.]|nr:HNH endonuclease [Pseudosphingobacterium sp.]
MRPIDKGSRPQLAGKNLEVKSYAEWRKHLIDRIGYYCSYCNIPLSHSLNIEHVVPKVPRDGENAGDYLQWENVLLACGPCNNKKGNNPIKPDQLYLPENNNTFISFQTAQHPDQ